MQRMRAETDLEVSRIIRAPRARVWNAWADPDRLAQWWIPRPTVCRVLHLDLRPGGAFVTEMSEGGGRDARGEGGGRDGRDGREKVFVPHINGCFLDVVPRERIVFTDALTAGWRPAANGFVTAVMTFRDHPDGTEYVARAMHKDPADRERHVELGFYDGWTTVIEQLAVLVEGERV